MHHFRRWDSPFSYERAAPFFSSGLLLLGLAVFFLLQKLIERSCNREVVQLLEFWREKMEDEKGCLSYFGLIILLFLSWHFAHAMLPIIRSLGLGHAWDSPLFFVAALFFFVFGINVFRILMNYGKLLAYYLVILGFLGSLGYYGHTIYPIIKSHPVTTSLGLNPEWDVPLHIAVVLLFVVLGFGVFRIIAGVFRIIITAIERLKPKPSKEELEAAWKKREAERKRIAEANMSRIREMTEEGGPLHHLFNKYKDFFNDLHGRK